MSVNVPGSFFLNLMSDITNSTRIESEDPRWIQLFSARHLSYLLNPSKLIEYWDKMTLNNLNSGNVVQLIEQTLSRLSQVTNKKSSPNWQTVDQCCIALYLCKLLLHHFVSTLTPVQIRNQLFLPNNWPENLKNRDSAVDIVNGQTIVESFIECLVTAVHRHHTHPWMHDISFFASDVLLTLTATQLYQVAGDGPSEEEDLFLTFLTRTAEAQLREALRSPAASFSTAFSSSLGVQLVKGLFMNGLSAGLSDPAGDGAVRPDSVMRGLLNHFGQESHRRKLPLDTNDTGLDVTRNVRSAGGGMQTILLELLASLSVTDNVLGRWLAQLVAGSGREEPGAGGSSEEVCGEALVVNWESMQLPALPLAERSLGLLLVLLHNKRSPNPFREVFCMLQDDTLDGPEGGADPGSGGLSMSSDIELMSRGKGALMVNKLHVDMRLAIAGLVRGLCGESFVLTLYSLLHTHPAFTDALLCTGSLEPVLEACLGGLYRLTAGSRTRLGGPPQLQAPPNQIYLLVICTLLLTQDSAVAGELAKIRTSVPWYKERQLVNVSLLDVLVLCTLRTVMVATFSMHDAYLLANCSAILHNVSGRVAQLHPYTAERVVKVLCQLCGRAARLEGETGGNNTRRQLVADALASVAKFVHVALRPQRRVDNVHLLYALMHDFEAVEQRLLSPALSGSCLDSSMPAVLSKVAALGKFHLSAIDALRGSDQDYHSAASAVDALKRSLASPWSFENQALATADEQVSNGMWGNSASWEQLYSYQETERPEEFFLPCVWAAVIRTAPETPWRLLNIALFNPVAAGFLTTSKHQMVYEAAELAHDVGSSTESSAV